MVHNFLALIHDPWFLSVAAAMIIGFAWLGWLVFKDRDEWP